ncbi:hypothetical protein EV426DRAFT_273918 [Tirmania nivea]|nr:hypothetical protein EV426DRAFT_273918 [Tirmania nivea]
MDWAFCTSALWGSGCTIFPRGIYLPSSHLFFYGGLITCRNSLFFPFSLLVLLIFYVFSFVFVICYMGILGAQYVYFYFSYIFDCHPLPLLRRLSFFILFWSGSIFCLRVPVRRT